METKHEVIKEGSNKAVDETDPQKIEIFGVMDGIKTYNIEENRKIFGDELPIC
jgi:hypothetical protein